MKKSGVSPTQRTLQECRNRGWLVEVVERFNPFSKTRKDLFGFIDILAVTEDGFLGIQATTRRHVAARVKKILNHQEEARHWLEAGGKIEVWGWGYMARSKSHECAVRECYLEDGKVLCRAPARTG